MSAQVIGFKRKLTAKKSIRVRDEEEKAKEDEEDETRVVFKNTTAGSSSDNAKETLGMATVATTIFESKGEAVPQQYAGDATYATILENNKHVPGNKYSGTQGPIRAPSFVRSTCWFDYQPDICKDYKETGFCGYGDQCKFLHDRGDYKSGWQLEKEWEEKQLQKKRKLEESMREMLAKAGMNGDEADSDAEDNGVLLRKSVTTTEPGEDGTGEAEEDNNNNTTGEEVDDDGLPFACYLCRNHFTNPVVTLCNHYFCYDCISKHNSSAAANNNKKCPVCGKNTSGVYNKAYKLIKKLKQQQ